MDWSIVNKGWKIEQIEWAVLPGVRPREAGKNARLGIHGGNVPAPLAKVRIGGVTGFGLSRISREKAAELVGTPVSWLFSESGLVKPEFRALEFPLLDWLGQLHAKPVYALFGRLDASNNKQELYVPCYDTTLYFDDVHLTDHQAAVELMQREASEGLSRGHRNFKIKVGRGARWMPLQEGTERDIRIIRAVREVAGPDGKIMIDANNGYNLNLTKQVLAATADANLYWIEEAFHEDRVLYEDLKEWIERENLSLLIADGEGRADPSLLNWAETGLIHVIQYDIVNPGFSYWLELGPRLDGIGVKTAPHSYGNVLGNYITGHLAAAIEGFQFVECDPAEVQGLDASMYQVADGFIRLPNAPGFGLSLDERFFAAKREESGWLVNGT